MNLNRRQCERESELCENSKESENTTLRDDNGALTILTVNFTQSRNANTLTMNFELIFLVFSSFPLLFLLVD